MKMVKFKLTFLLVILIVNIYDCYGMTEAQIQSTGKLIRNMCQPKSKATDAQIDNFHKGVFDNEDKKIMCYYHCVDNMMKIINKENKLDLAGAMSQLPGLPDKYKESTKVSLEECKDRGGHADKCEAGYDLAKCIYLSNPEKFFMP